MTNEQTKQTGEGIALRKLAGMKLADAMRNIKAQVHWRGSQGGSGVDRISIGWEIGDERYHVWLTTDKRMDDMTCDHVHLGSIYYVDKNKVYANRETDQGYTNTRILNAAAQCNLPMVRNAWLMSDIDGAFADYDRKQADEQAERDHARKAVWLNVTSGAGEKKLSIDIRDLNLDAWSSSENLQVLRQIVDAVEQLKKAQS